MKYIFRYTILNYYTFEKNITLDDLKSAIDPTFPHQLEPLINTFRHLIQDLIHNKQQDKISTIIHQHLNPTYPGEYPELVQVWQNEKYLVYGKICAQNTQTSAYLQKISWSTSTQIASKYGEEKEMRGRIKIQGINSKEKKEYIFMELGRKDAKKVERVLQKASQFLNKCLLQN